METDGNRKTHNTSITVITYGTFDLFHVGHLNLLSRLKSLGDRLIVGVSTDEFNESKGKSTIIPFSDRSKIVSSIKHVDLVIPESTWNQKSEDIRKYKVDILGMGNDWQGKFDDLSSLCKVVYLPRTDGISSTKIKKILSTVDIDQIQNLKKALDLMSSIIEKLE